MNDRIKMISDDFILLHDIDTKSPRLLRISEILTAWERTTDDWTGTRLATGDGFHYIDVRETVEEVAEIIRKPQKFVMEVPYPVLR